MNRGSFNGLTPGVWQRYKPKVVAIGATTQPFLDDIGTTQFVTAQYLQRGDGRVEVIYQGQFVGNATVGTMPTTASCPYYFNLPFPAYRPGPPNTSCPAPIGTGMCYMSFATPPTNRNYNCDATPTIADPVVDPIISDPDYWFQAYVPWRLGVAHYTGGSITSLTMANNANPYTFTTSAGYAFNPEDVENLNLPNSTITNNFWPLAVTAISSIGDITLTPQNASGPNGTSQAVVFRIRAEPPAGSQGALVGTESPFLWTNVSPVGPFGNFFFHLKYRPRR